MPSYLDSNITVKISRFYIKVVGIWYAETSREKRMLNGALIYTIAALVFAMAVILIDLHHIWGKLHFHDIMENIQLSITLLSAILKLMIAIARKDAIIDAIIFSEKYFWKVKYESFGEQVLNECERKGIILLCNLAFAVQGTAVFYISRPLITYSGLNDTHRALPFGLYVHLPLTVTPYYEITYTIQCLSIIHSGICFFCFDNLLGILNIHIVGQFKILQHRLDTLCDECTSHVHDESQTNYFETVDVNLPREIFDKNKILRMQNDIETAGVKKNHSDLSTQSYDELKKCVKQHLFLINYVERLEYVFSPMLFCQMGFSSLLICLTGFQTFVVRRQAFMLQLLAACSQTLIFTWTCNEIITQSMEIANYAFSAKWYTIPDTEEGRSIRKGLMMLMMRSRRACSLTAGKFHVISLQSFMNILGTTSSYLSILRQLSDGTYD
ncbi:odorant receptor 83a-like [Neodiprion lecontei]|uniref:Odorant receptor n=1 Tax=Neodiprion lecontei TaxID=441921 RepID=A0ABM3GC84_NEOLC|nr:odorant receptor 83a-like [Neodiprion lecontei]